MSDTSHDRLHAQGGIPPEVSEAARAAYLKIQSAVPYAAHVLMYTHGVAPLGAEQQPYTEPAAAEPEPVANQALEAPVAQTETDAARALVREAIGG